MAEAAAGASFWSTKEEALAFLNPLLELAAPSKAACGLLAAAPIGAYMKGQQPDPQVAALFLQATAKHLAALATSEVGDDSGRLKQIHDVVETAGSAATHCTLTNSNRCIVSQSGILLALNKVMTMHRNTITAAHVEFLSCALLAGQYRFARRMVDDEWPTPHRASTVEQVLRYYYLRGMIHIGCDEFKMAIRCFWTVLSVPMEVVSAIAVEAWKKMVLCHCFTMPNNTGVSVTFPYQQLVALPPASSSALARLLTATNAPEVETTAQEGNNGHHHHAISMGIPAYVEVAKSLGDSRAKFLEVKAKYAAQWTADKTSGLMERLKTDLLFRHIQKLASIYSVISLSQLSAELETPVEALAALLRQVKGLVVAEKDGMVTFDRIPKEPMPTENIPELMVLTERIRKLDAAIASSSKFQHLQGDSSAAGRGPQGVEDF